MSLGFPVTERTYVLYNTSSARRNENKVGIAIYLVFLTLFLFTLSSNLSVAHDSPAYAANILNVKPIFYPNHLLHEPILAGMVWVLQKLGFSPGLLTIEIPGAFAGAATLTAAFLILVRRMSVPISTAVASVTVAGVSFGIWYYSVAVEIYIYSLCFMTWAFFLLLDDKKNVLKLATAALLQSLAILLHQTSILFSCVPLVVLLGAGSLPFARRLQLLLIYGLIGILVVGGAYFIVAFALGYTESFANFWYWFIGYGADKRYWSPLGVKALLLAGVGFSRAIVGGHFIFAIPAVQRRLQALFSDHRLDDEVFLVRHYAGGIAEGLLALNLFWGIAAVPVAALAVAGSIRLLRLGRSRLLVPVLTWLVPYVLFFSAWDASNVDFWIPQVLLIWMLIAVCLAARYPAAQATRMLAGLAVGLAILNGIGSIIPAHTQANDYNHAKVAALTQAMDPSGLIILGDAWPDIYHLRFLSTDLSVVALTNLYQQGKNDPAQTERILEEFGTVLRQALRTKRPVYLWPDAFSIHPGTLAVHGPAYKRFVEAIQSQTCGTTMLPSTLTFAAYRLRCMR